MPPFLTLPLFHQPLLLLWEKSEPSPFRKNFKNSAPPPFIKGCGGSNYVNNFSQYPEYIIKSPDV